MKIETWALSKITPYPKNARKIPQRAIDKVALSLKTYGWQQPIVVDKQGVIVAGHTRYLAAQSLGWTEAPVTLFVGTPAQARAYRIMDNRSHEEASWDMDLLAFELGDLKGLDLDLSLTGFDPREIGKLLPESHDEPEAQMDRAEELQRKWKVERGQVWEIGEHRLMCGDSTQRDDVGELMDGQKAALFATDPPYGVGYGVDSGPDSAKRFTAMTGDGATGEELQRFLEAAFRAAMPNLQPDAAWYLWHAQMTQGFFAAAAAAAQLLVHRQIIWAKSHFILGHGDYHWQHELCFYGWREGNRAPWYGGRDQSTLWEIPNPRAAEAHATGKPAELFARPMRNHTVANDVCMELFAGSGAQFVAAQQLNRRCYGMEIEPKYCAVILERMTAMGLKPQLAHVHA